MVQVREKSHWDQGGGVAHSEKQSNPEHILWRQLTEFLTSQMSLEAVDLLVCLPCKAKNSIITEQMYYSAQIICTNIAFVL